VELRDLETGALSRRVPLSSAFPHFAVDDDGVVVCAAPIGAPEPLHAIRVSVGDEAPFFAEELLAQARGRVPEIVERWNVDAIALTRAHVALVLRDRFPTATDDEADHLVLLVTRATRESSVFPLAESVGGARWAELLSPRELALCHDGGCTQIDLVTGATRIARRSPDALSELHTSRSVAWCGSSRVEIGRHHVAVRQANDAWTIWNVETMRHRSIRGCELAMLDGDRVLQRDAHGAVVTDADTGREIARLDDVRRVAPHPSGGALAWTESGAYSVTDRGFELIGPSSVSLFGETRTWSSISDDLRTVFAFEQLDGRVRFGAYVLSPTGARPLWEREALAHLNSGEISPDGTLISVDAAGREVLLSVDTGLRPPTFAPRAHSIITFTFRSEIVVSDRGDPSTSDVLGAPGQQTVARDWLLGGRRRVGEHRLFAAHDVAYLVDGRERTRAAIQAVDDGFVMVTPSGVFFGSPGSERALLRRVDEERVVAVDAGEADPQLFEALLASDGVGRGNAARGHTARRPQPHASSCSTRLPCGSSGERAY
jgi:hypothetical protein